MWILVTDPDDEYCGSILEVKEEFWLEINDENIVWVIYSVNGNSSSKEGFF